MWCGVVKLSVLGTSTGYQADLSDLLISFYFEANKGRREDRLLKNHSARMPPWDDWTVFSGPSEKTACTVMYISLLCPVTLHAGWWDMSTVHTILLIVLPPLFSTGSSSRLSRSLAAAAASTAVPQALCPALWLYHHVGKVFHLA